MENKPLQMVEETNKTLKYDTLSLASNISISSMDLKSGVFTAPFPGKYYRTMYNLHVNEIYFQKNFES